MAWSFRNRNSASKNPRKVIAAPFRKGRLVLMSIKKPARSGPANRPRLIKELFSPRAKPCSTSARLEKRSTSRSSRAFFGVVRVWADLPRLHQLPGVPQRLKQAAKAERLDFEGQDAFLERHFG